MSGSSISIRDVTKTFGMDTITPHEALRRVTVDVAPGEFLSIVGPSGCGKSTLMLMVAGLLDVTGGSIYVDQTAIDGPLTDIGIAFQDHLLLDFYTAMDNVMLQAKIRGLPHQKTRKRAEELFDQLRLRNAKKKYPRQLSGGMRQRVSIIRALVHEPSILLFDEPFGALDALTRLQVRSDLEALWMHRKPTVLFITHSVEEAVGLSDRILVMGPGPGEIIDEIIVDLPRPRSITLGDSPEFGAYVERIYGLFRRMGILQGVEVSVAAQ